MDFWAPTRPMMYWGVNRRPKKSTLQEISSSRSIIISETRFVDDWIIFSLWKSADIIFLCWNKQTWCLQTTVHISWKSGNFSLSCLGQRLGSSIWKQDYVGKVHELFLLKWNWILSGCIDLGEKLPVWLNLMQHKYWWLIFLVTRHRKNSYMYNHESSSVTPK